MTTDQTQVAELCRQLHTVRDFIRYGASQFAAAGLHFGHGTDNAWDEAVYLVTYAIHLGGSENPHILDARLTQTEKQQLLALFARRLEERLPAAYLIGEAWFCGLPFYVDERVLVPRSPMAELIESAFSPWLSAAPDYVLDLCTGSGCIGIATALQFPDAQVDLADISPDALTVAARNIQRYELDHRVRAHESDLFAGLEGRCYDLIVCNPPYVDAEDLAAMPAEFHAEPAIGLGSGADGLDFTRRLLAQAADYLNDDGLLVVEVGNSASALAAAFPELPLQWVEFQRGGHGVFALTREQLLTACSAMVGEAH